MPTVHAFSRSISWEKWEKKSPEKQTGFLAEYKDRFERESVSSDLKNVKKGDHLVRQCSTNFLGECEHHFLCTGVNYSDEGSVVSIEVVEYTTDLGLSANPTGYLRASGNVDLTGLGKIKLVTYTYEKLEEQRVEKEIWPEELERFDVMEVVERAKRRVGESYYDILKNNCEHFIRWCKCGLKVSLQVKSWYTWARECLYSLVAGGKECIFQRAGKKLIIPLIANVSDELAGLLGKKYAATVAGFAVGFILETGLCVYEIIKAQDQRKKGLIESDKLFWAKIVGIVAKAVCRLGLGTIGSVVGLAGGPLGSLIGGAIGGAAGHLLGFCIGWCYENRQYLDG